MATKKKATSRVQRNGKAGSGTTVNMAGLARVDEFLREKGGNPKFSFTGVSKKAAPKRKVAKKAVKRRVKRGK